MKRTRMFGVSLSWPATSFARSAVEANVRIAAREQPVERATAPNGRTTACRIAIVCERVVNCAWSRKGRPAVMMSTSRSHAQASIAQLMSATLAVSMCKCSL
jgi:hypothetical protein